MFCKNRTPFEFDCRDWPAVYVSFRMIPYEGQMAFEEVELPAARASHGNGHHKFGKCDHKTCAVGRHSKRNSSWFRQKIHFVDVSKLRQPKLCMKASLVGDDCKPLLIKAGEDVTVPLVTPDYGQQQSLQQEDEEQGKQQRDKSGKKKGRSRFHCGKCGLLLDALARTFCLPLLG